MTDQELNQRSADIGTAEDFVRIFNKVRPRSMGSPRRCADELRGLTPPEKHEIADEAIELCRQQFPGRSWYHAGD